MRNDTIVAEARNRMIPILVDTIEIDYRNGGLGALEMAKSNLEDAIKGLDIAIKEMDDYRFAKVIAGMDETAVKIKRLDAQIRQAITPELLRKNGGM